MIKLSFVGDISLGEHYLSFGHGTRSAMVSGKQIFDGVSELFTDSDLVFGNLEGPISDLGYNPESPHSRVFRGAPQSVHQLKMAGFNILTVANNHSVQHGIDTINDTISILESAGITVVGLRANPITYLKTAEGTIAIISCSLIRDNTDTEQQVYFAPSEQELIATVRSASKDGILTIVYIHWGIEGTTVASAEQRHLAAAMRNAGASIIVGHHTHSLQPVIIDEDSLIAFSLGNFVFDQCWSYLNRESTVLQFQVTNKKIHDICHNKLWLDTNGIPHLVKRAIPLSTGEHILSDSDVPQTNNEGVAKIIYFLKNLFRGKTKVKLRFLAWKISQKIT